MLKLNPSFFLLLLSPYFSPSFPSSSCSSFPPSSSSSSSIFFPPPPPSPISLLFFPKLRHYTIVHCSESAGMSTGSKARSVLKLSVLRRPKHHREAAQNVLIVEECIRADTNCSQGVSTSVTSKRAGDRFPN